MFFDLENVLGGYGKLAESLERVSLPSIVETIRQDGRRLELIEEFAVKRAYADWSVTRLASLRRELVELGIEPRQTFAFGSQGKTNAADVELVIDVLDLAYTRPEISTYVIVSGDGGFGTLVRKLHEFGKTVIVGAYVEKANRGLKAVCDHFVDLSSTRPAGEDAEASTARGVASAAQRPLAVTTTTAAGGTASLSGRVIEAMLTIEDERSAPLLDRARVLLDGIMHHPSLEATVRRRGLNATYVAQALQQRIPKDDMDAMFGKFSRLVRAAQTDMEWCYASGDDPTTNLLVFRDAMPAKYSATADQQAPTQQERCSLYLARHRLALPDPIDDLYTVMSALEKAPIDRAGQQRQEIIDRMIAEDLAKDMPVDEIRRCLTVLVGAGVLSVSEATSPATAAYVQHVESFDAMYDAVRRTVIRTLDAGGFPGHDFWRELTGDSTDLVAA
jgi:uncharacterized LabA/DUF88 family protein